MPKSLPLEEAQQAILNRITPLTSEVIPSMEAVGRILAVDLTSPHDLPPYRQAAMDGYAISVRDNQGKFIIKNNLAAGEVPDFTLQPGEGAGVLTGGHVPQGTTLVIRQEDAHRAENFITFNEMPANKNIREQGEDFQSGEVIARKGSIINPGLIAILTAYGLRHIEAIRRPRVAVLSLGSEIIPLEQKPLPGQVWNSNGYLLSSLINLQGGSAKVLVSRSSPENELSSLLEEADMVLTIGGTANGENDRCRELLSEAGVQPIFFGYQVKPGGHTCAGSKNGKPVIMLSGNPMACFVGYCLLAKPALCALQGLSPKMKRFPALATSPFLKKGGPRRFLLGYALCSPGGWRVAVLPAQKSSMRRSLADCNCLIDLPAGHPPVQPEDPVDIIPLGE
ncbi:MAG: molybdopterin molybdotransferase MoeA [Syntrophaceticus sp.]|jgi:molybdopterin molybdotransferase